MTTYNIILSQCLYLGNGKVTGKNFSETLIKESCRKIVKY